ncbi:conserved hypothetical protein [Ruegeria lacuscaerulensis ITI-1157]|nr:conserved hypothetical protein [Ruegeria lacuscaerulensis ITI-1157]SHI57981.1 hypothetical protein SAMN05444404_0566 [Ruegeria lacuscaerulensis ITI-1157]
MTPAFALSLSENGITLLHRSDGEWFGIGSVTLDDPDFSENLTELRKQAFALANDLSCTVVIPAEHVRYLVIPADASDEGDSTARIEAALVAATPYAAEELAFDSHRRGSDLHVAAIARETLDEARRFTVQYGFVPIRFVAPLQDQTWPGPAEFTFDPSPTLAPPDTAPGPKPTLDAPADHGAVDQADASPAKPEPGPEADGAATSTAHPIAEPADPAAFRSFDVQEKPTLIPAQVGSGNRIWRYGIPAIAAAVVFGVVIGALSLDSDETTPVAVMPEPRTAEPPTFDEPNADIAQTGSEQPEEALARSGTLAPTNLSDEPDASAPDPEALADLAEPSDSEPQDKPATAPDLTPTDTAILEALKVAPAPVDQIQRDPESEEVFREVTGLSTTPPEAPPVPPQEALDETYLSSIDPVGFSQDAVALPDSQSFDTDDPVAQVSLPNAPGSRFDLGARGLVVPTPEGSLNPDGVIVYLGRPPSVPPEVPVRFETTPSDSGLDDRLAELRPKARPSDLVEGFERNRLGGRSLNELARIRPKLRPKSLQDQPQADQTPTALAVVRAPRPRVRPSTVAALAATKSNTGSAALASTAAVPNADDDEGAFQPKTVAPKIPSSASVARRATMDNAINLRRLNLIGVYGTPANRRALVRLPSGRYKKLKVGDRIDGGNVIAIGDSELRYQKRGQNITLKMPRG